MRSATSSIFPVNYQTQPKGKSLEKRCYATLTKVESKEINKNETKNKNIQKGY